MWGSPSEEHLSGAGRSQVPPGVTSQASWHWLLALPVLMARLFSEDDHKARQKEKTTSADGFQPRGQPACGGQPGLERPFHKVTAPCKKMRSF